MWLKSLRHNGFRASKTLVPVRDFHKNQFSTRPALDESTAGSHMFERQRLEATSYPLGAQRVSALPWLNHRPWLDGSLSV